ncbi:MAG: LysR family transcriptional regulator [Xanthobacteraceae bacterium]
MSVFKEEGVENVFDVHGLRYFLQVADSGGFSKAAAVLNVPQPTLSRSIRRLEEHFKARLFDRNGRGALLTEAGESFYQHGKAILLRLEQAQAEMAEISSNPTGSAVLALGPVAGKVLSSVVAERFLKEVPSSKLRIVESYTGFVLEWVANGRVDIGLLYEDALTPTLKGERLWIEEPVLVSSRVHAFAGQESISFAQLENMPLILPGRPHGLRLRVDEVAAELGIRLNVVLEVDGLSGILDLVRRDVGCSILTPPALYGYKHDADIALTKLRDPVVSSTVVAVTSKQRPMTNTVKALLQIVREEARKVRSTGFAKSDPVRKPDNVEILQPRIAQRSRISRS